MTTSTRKTKARGKKKTGPDGGDLWTEGRSTKKLRKE